MNYNEETLLNTAQAAVRNHNARYVRDQALNAAQRCIANQTPATATEAPSTWELVDEVIEACDEAHARYVRDTALAAAQRCIQNA